jgi:hypothetical protein
MDDLDHILLCQYHATKRQLKLIKRIKKLLKNDPKVDDVEYQSKMKLQFFEDMIEDKTLLDSKPPKVKKEEDVLDKNPVYTMYKNTMMFTMFGYKVFSDAMQTYLSAFYKKDK